ncbi:MAG: hydrogenase maturation protease [Actinocatenispora sp.]
MSSPAQSAGPGRTLVAGIGNIFLADDGFGVEVARRLAEVDLPDGAEVGDYGIRGMHLAYDLLAGYDTTILVDAVARGEEPGTVTLLEIDPSQPAVTGSSLDAHGMQPDAVLALLDTLGGTPGRVLLVGCEPAEVCDRIGLSAPVAAAVPHAVALVRDLLGEQSHRPAALRAGTS